MHDMCNVANLFLPSYHKKYISSNQKFTIYIQKKLLPSDPNNHTFISGSRKLAWSQSTDTTGSLVDMDCTEEDAVTPLTDEAIVEK